VRIEGVKVEKNPLVAGAVIEPLKGRNVDAARAVVDHRQPVRPVILAQRQEGHVFKPASETEGRGEVWVGGEGGRTVAGSREILGQGRRSFGG